MRITDAIRDGSLVKIETGKIARVGRVTKAEVYAVRTAVNCSFERRQTARRANPFQGRNNRRR